MKYKNNKGLTMIEFLLVIIILGILLNVVVVRGRLASENVRLGQALQQGSEIAGYLVAWAQHQAEANSDSSSYVLKDLINREGYGVAIRPLVNRYTGSDNFDVIENFIPGDLLPQNPFNGKSYFDPQNDDPENIPSSRPGLLYLTSAVKENYRSFYLLVTGMNGGWYNDAGPDDPEFVRRGIFVAQTNE